MNGGAIQVEVVYALPAVQPLMRVALVEGATVGDAVRASGLLRPIPTSTSPKTRSASSASW